MPKGHNGPVLSSDRGRFGQRRQGKGGAGDDPDRTGSYQFTFTVYNLSQEPKTYAFGSDVLTEAVETLDGVDYMAETSHGLSPKVDFAVASMPYDLTETTGWTGRTPWRSCATVTAV